MKTAAKSGCFAHSDYLKNGGHSMPIWLNLLLTTAILLLQIYLGLLLFDLKRPFLKLILIAMIAAIANNAMEFWFGLYSPIKIIVPVIILICLYAYFAKTNILKSALAIIMGGNIIYFIDSITMLLFINLLKILPMELFNDSLLNIIAVIIFISQGLVVIVLIKTRNWKLSNLSQLADKGSKAYKTTMLLLMAMPSIVYCFICFLTDYTLSFPANNISIILNIANALFLAYFFGLFIFLQRTEQESEQKYYDLFNSVDEGFCIIEVLFDDNDRPLDYCFLETNKAFKKQPGIVGAAGRCMREIAPENEQHWFDIYGHVALTGEPTRFQKPADALGFYYNVYAFRVGKPEQRRVAILFNDITEQKKTEEALRESEQKFKTLAEELELADKNKNDFIGVLSHELRNPLATIAAGIDLLDKYDDNKKTEKTKESMKRQMAHLIKLVDDLLDVSRISHNKIKLKMEKIDLTKTTRKNIEDIRPEFEKRGVQLHTKIQLQQIFIDADAVRISQIIGNILGNALKFTPKDGVVWFSLKQKQQNAVITVKDNGPGIDPEILPHIFEVFTQAEQSLDRQNSGLGLGLSIVKRIVDLHGGNITAYSAGLGKGSEFTISLPIS